MQTEGSGGRGRPAHALTRPTASSSTSTPAPSRSRRRLFVEVTGMVREKDGETQIGADGADVDMLLERARSIASTEPPHGPTPSRSGSYLEGLLVPPRRQLHHHRQLPDQLQRRADAGPGRRSAAPAHRGGRARHGRSSTTRRPRTPRGRSSSTTRSTTLFLLAPNQDETPPYISNTTPYRTGATGTFIDDVIFSEGASGYRFEPLDAGRRPGQHRLAVRPGAPASTAPDAARIEADGHARSSRSRRSTC